MKKSDEKLHILIMHELQKEWEESRDIHMKYHGNMYGIRSSQISALVALLIKKGIIGSSYLYDKGGDL